MAGRRRTTERDWLLGGPGRCAVLSCLLDPGASERSWIQSELAGASGLGRKGSVDVHLAGLVQLEVIARDGRSYRVNARSPLVAPLRVLLDATRVLSDRPIDFGSR